MSVSANKNEMNPMSASSSSKLLPQYIQAAPQLQPVVSPVLNRQLSEIAIVKSSIEGNEKKQKLLEKNQDFAIQTTANKLILDINKEITLEDLKAVEHKILIKGYSYSINPRFYHEVILPTITTHKNNNLKIILDYFSANKNIQKLIIKTKTAEVKNILTYAIDLKNYEAVKLILEYLAKHHYTSEILNSFAYEHDTPLVYAIKKGNSIIVEEILKEHFKYDDSFNINEIINEDDNSTLLHLACSIGDSAVIQLLISNGANINIINNNNLKPFQLLPSLVESDIDNKTKGAKSLKRKAKEIQSEDSLFDFQESFEVTTNVAQSLQNQVKEDVKKMLDTLGSQVNLNAPYNGELTILQHLLIAYGGDVLDLLFDQGSSDSKKINKKKKKVIVGSKKDDAEGQILESKQTYEKAKINDHIDRENNTALHLFCKKSNDNYYVVKTMINFGAEVNALNIHKQTPLHLAIINNNFQIATNLLKSKNIDFNIRDNDNKTPLDYINDNAASSGFKEAFAYLKTANEKRLNLEVLSEAFIKLKNI